jgi:hypothetical protein
MRRDTEIYVLFKTGELLDFFTSVRRKSYKVVWLVRQGRRVKLQTEDKEYSLQPYRVCNLSKAPAVTDPEVDVIDLCSKHVRRLTGSMKQYPPNSSSRVEMIVNFETNEFCMIRLDGYPETASPWDAMVQGD